MTDRIRALEELLARTEAAHGVFETTELNGVYDREWARWYAEFAVDQGIGDLLGRPVSADELAALLASGWDDFQQIDARAEPWAAYVARRIATQLSGD
jgi:hypothetical protein